jgi:hypothetical protein
MERDETATVTTLTLFKQMIAALITEHQGRVIDSPGDNILSEFQSIINAVGCAVAIQKELRSRNAELPENRQMQYRIGINLGDVIEEGDRIFGDGVNIAARLEGLSEVGGICLALMKKEVYPRHWAILFNHKPLIFINDTLVLRCLSCYSMFKMKTEAHNRFLPIRIFQTGQHSFFQMPQPFLSVFWRR